LETVTSNFDLLWVILEKIYKITHIAGFALFIWAAAVMIRERRKLHKKLLSLETSEGLSRRPVAIAIGIGKDPTDSARHFLADHGWSKIPVISWNAEGFLKPEAYPEAMAKINDLRKQALKLGVSEVLLFYAGPVDLGMFIGASFDNWVPVKIFAFSNGTYEHRLTLEREASRMNPLVDEMARVAEEAFNPIA